MLNWKHNKYEIKTWKTFVLTVGATRPINSYSNNDVPKCLLYIKDWKQGQIKIKKWKMMKQKHRRKLFFDVTVHHTWLTSKIGLITALLQKCEQCWICVKGSHTGSQFSDLFIFFVLFLFCFCFCFLIANVYFSTLQEPSLNFSFFLLFSH